MITWPALPTCPDRPDRRPDDALPFWRYQGVNTIGGRAHVRAWHTDGPWLIVVSERGEGCSVTNAAHHIHQGLYAIYGDLVLLEHYPSSERSGGATLDQVTMVDGRPLWRRVWPLQPRDPDYAEMVAWVRGGGAPVLDALNWDGPR